ncbi:MAG TPA: hypothetical protein VGJ84_02405 [Polyangiaceae bacterium]
MLNDCKQFCAALIPNLSPDCQTKWKAFYDCEFAQPNVCDSMAVSQACSAQQNAANSCM